MAGPQAKLPDIGTEIVVDLPGERTYATVTEHEKGRKVRAVLTRATMAMLGHGYKQNDSVTFAQQADVQRGRMWVPVENHGMSMAASGRAGGMR